MLRFEFTLTPAGDAGAVPKLASAMSVGLAGRRRCASESVLNAFGAAFTGAAGITSAGVAVAGVVVPGWVLAGVPGGRACAGFTFAEAGLAAGDLPSGIGEGPGGKQATRPGARF